MDYLASVFLVVALVAPVAVILPLGSRVTGQDRRDWGSFVAHAVSDGDSAEPRKRR